jgi:hypothetical protein
MLRKQNETNAEGEANSEFECCVTVKYKLVMKCLKGPLRDLRMENAGTVSEENSTKTSGTN